MGDKRQPIAFVRCVVQFPLYEGDITESQTGWNNFVYEEPGITASGDLGVCRRRCQAISSKVIYVSSGEDASE